MTIQQLLPLLKNTKKTGSNKYIASCPAHEDKKPSLAITDQDGTLLIHCFAGCDYKLICGALGISAKDLFFHEKNYDYGVAKKEKYRNPETMEKTFVFTYQSKNKPDKIPLFCSPSLEAAQKATRIYLTEGEKDAETIARLGGVACSGHTSGLPKTCDITPLTGKEIVIVPDQDEAGIKHASMCIARLIKEKVNSGPLLIWEPPDWIKDLPEEEKIKDITEYIERVEDATIKDIEDQVIIIPQEYLDAHFGTQSDQHDQPPEEEDITALPVITPQSRPPTIHPDAFNTYLGRLIMAIADKTEAHPDPILTQIITKLGTAMSAYTNVPMSGEKSPILFNLVIGETGTGRKGTSLEVANMFVDSILNYQLPTLHAISTPEGIIQFAGSFSKQEITGAWFPILTIEIEEFSNLFKIAKRECNPIFQMIRRFWDSPKTLEVPTRKNPLSISNPKISITGHITPLSIKKHLAMEEMDGGTINRFIFTWSERSNKTEYFSLSEEIKELTKPIKEKLSGFMGQLQNVRLSQEARNIWFVEKDKYANSNDMISTRHTGNLTRIATILAILDPDNPDNAIGKADMLAAVAILEHSYLAFNFVLGLDQLGINEREIITLLESAKGNMATRTQISAHFGRNLSSSEISKAIDGLVDKNMVAIEKRKAKFRPISVVVLRANSSQRT